MSDGTGTAFGRAGKVEADAKSCLPSRTGAGLGNAFLSHVRAVDGIFGMVRAFDDAEVTHVEGDVDPVRDMEIISTELRLKDAEWLEKHIATLKRLFRGTGTLNLADKAKKFEIDTCEKAFKAVSEDNMDIRKVDWASKEVGCRSVRCRYRSTRRSPRINYLSDDRVHESAPISITQLVEDVRAPRSPRRSLKRKTVTCLTPSQHLRPFRYRQSK